MPKPVKSERDQFSEAFKIRNVSKIKSAIKVFGHGATKGGYVLLRNLS